MSSAAVVRGLQQRAARALWVGTRRSLTVRPVRETWCAGSSGWRSSTLRTVRARGNGAARTVLTALAGWATAHEAGQMYLQVEPGNAPALRLYERAGFGEICGYHYRVAAGAGADPGGPHAAHAHGHHRRPRTAGRGRQKHSDRDGDPTGVRPAGQGPTIDPVETRELGRTGRQVGVVGLGAWQLGADWGQVSEDDALATLNAAVDAGVTFVDTADVYGDGRSEQIVGRLLKERPGLTVATKMGRRGPQEPSAYTLDNFRAWNDRSRRNLGVDTIDLVQLHCPPTPVYDAGSVYDALDSLVEDGRIAAYGVSVETCDEALTAIARPGVATVQIILNAFRLKPLEKVLPAAIAAGVGVIARVPLASGMLSGRYDRDTEFGADDHRTFNRHGEAFDVGETFAGVDYDTALAAVDRLRSLVPEGMTMAQFALRWIIEQPGVSVVIPGARNAEQARANAAVAQLPPLDDETRASVANVYDELVRPLVHDRW